MTNAEFNEMLRAQAIKLAKGEVKEFRVCVADIYDRVDEPEKYNRGYLRQTVARVKEVRSAGAITMRSVVDDVDGLTYIFSIDDSKKPEIVTSESLDVIKTRWKRDFIKFLLKSQPRITDLRGEQLEGAAIALERFADFLNGLEVGEHV